jgi:hypothetical protein
MKEFRKWKLAIMLVLILQNMVFPLIIAYIPLLYLNSKLSFFPFGVIIALSFSFLSYFIIGILLDNDDDKFIEKLNNNSLVSLPTPVIERGIFYWLGDINLNPVVLYALVIEFGIFNLIYWIW